jgi:hypothetical protein
MFKTANHKNTPEKCHSDPAVLNLFLENDITEPDTAGRLANAGAALIAQMELLLEVEE